MMRKESPIKNEAPEWKKEVAEKVKAYGERKKRLTTPPGPLKENNPASAAMPAEPPVSEPPRISQPVSSPPRIRIDEPEPATATPTSQPDIWTENLEALPGLKEFLENEEEPQAPPESYLLRRIAAGIIDHTIILVLLLVFLGGFSLFTGQPMETLFAAWKTTVPIFLVIHLVYHLYFYRSARQTPGMVFLSLELRDPSVAVIPLAKILSRWLCLVFLNVFNFIPALRGKPYLLLDQISGTELRSFK
jgi:uncharacterized RDD family membrane protein YckC